jgi:hypothetical protein
MPDTVVRLAAAAFAAVLVGVLVLRRRKRAE